MASMKDIKRRRTSIQSTQQITKAMKLVSTVKLQKARSHAERAKAYFQTMYETITSMLEKTEKINHPYLETREEGKIAIVVITSNRGLAGGYNSNIVKLVRDYGFKKEDVRIYAIGHKGLEGLAAKGFEIAHDYSGIVEDPTYREASEIGKQLLKDFENQEICEIYMAYTVFKNTVSHIPTMLKLLPIEPSKDMKKEDVETEKGGNEDAGNDLDELTLMNFEPTPEEALDMLVPKYISSIIYGGMIEAIASENGARMAAMDNATDNAQEMIDHLELSYNRARQGAITQELTEIIAGADALNA